MIKNADVSIFPPDMFTVIAITVCHLAYYITCNTHDVNKKCYLSLKSIIRDGEKCLVSIFVIIFAYFAIVTWLLISTSG